MLTLIGYLPIRKGTIFDPSATLRHRTQLEHTKNVQKTSRKSFGGLMYIQLTPSVLGEVLATITILFQYKSIIFIFIFSYLFFPAFS